MLTKINVPVNFEVAGLVAATIGAARGDGKEEWDSDSGASFLMSHTQAGMTAYKKAPAGTTVEFADGTILPVGGFGTVEGDLDQPGTTTKPVKMISDASVPGFSRKLLSTRKAVDQWGKPIVYNKAKTVLGFPGEESLVFNFCPRKGLFSAADVRRTPSQGTALGLTAKTVEAMRIEETNQWGPCAAVRGIPRQGTALAVVLKAHDMVEVHRELAHPSKEITQETAQAMGIATTGQWGFYEARLQAEAKRQTVLWVDGPDKTDRQGVGDEDRDVKPSEDESVGRRGAPQLDVQELELEQQPASLERNKKIQEAPPDPEEGTQEARPDPEGTQKAPLDPDEESRQAPSDREEETRKALSDPQEKKQEAPPDPNEGTQEAPPDLE